MGRVALIACVALSAIPARADRVTDFAHVLATGRDARTRLVAAIGLVRTQDERAVPPLMRALSDDDTTVRGVAAAALGKLGDVRAIPALERALSDSNPFVRDKARESLSLLRAIADRAKTVVPREAPPPPLVVTPPTKDTRAFVTVKSTYNRTLSGGKPMAAEMRRYLEDELGHTREVSLDVASHGKSDAFTIDGSITEISKKLNGPYIEVSCNVSLVVGTYPDGRVLTMVSGGATVQMPKRSWKPAMEKSVQLDALANAVKGAHQSLVGYLLKKK